MNNESTDYRPLDLGDTTVDTAIMVQPIWDVNDPIIWIVDVYQGCHVIT